MTTPFLHKIKRLFNSAPPANADTGKSWMLAPDEPAIQDIVQRASALGVTGDPDRASHYLGKVLLADGRAVQAFVIHAVDPVITDGKSVVMIDRLKDPGQGKPALPGGFIDPKNGGAETGIEAGIRESFEEAGIILSGGALIGKRSMARPFDVRIAQGNALWKKHGVPSGAIFMVSTQTVRFDVPDLAALNLSAGDDARPGSARLVPIEQITRATVGIPDHADAVKEAVKEAAENLRINAAPDHLAPCPAPDA